MERTKSAARIHTRQSHATFLLCLELPEVLFSEVYEARHNVFPDQFLWPCHWALLRHLDLQPAPAKVEIHDFNDAGGGCGRFGTLMLGDLVPAGDTKVDSSLSYEGWNVGRGEEDQSEWMVLDESNVETRMTVELDVGTMQKIQAGLVEAALWWLSILEAWCCWGT